MELPSLPPPQSHYRGNSTGSSSVGTQSDYNHLSASRHTIQSGQSLIQEHQLTRKNLKTLLHVITGELKARGTKTPHIFLPFRSRIDDSKLEMFLINLFPNGILTHHEYYVPLLKKTDEFTLVCSLKYLWCRLPNNEVIGWDVYLEYKRKEKAAGYPRNAFLSIMPKCLSSPAHASIVYDFLDLLISVASNSQYNYLSGRKICKMASLWAFNSLVKSQQSKNHSSSPFYDATIMTDNNFIEGLDSWKQTSSALFHLLLSFLRAMLPDSEQETLKLPKTLQSLLITNAYPPLDNSDSIKSLITIPCVLVRSTKPSKTAFEMLSKVRNTISFDKKDAFVSVENYTILKNIFRKQSTNEIVSTLTEESRRILNRITAEPIQSDFGIYPGWVKPEDSEDNRRQYEYEGIDDDIPLISQINIIDVTLQDYYIWTWLSSLSSDQCVPNKKLFGRSLVVEAGLKGFEKWLIVTEELITPKEYYKKFKTLDFPKVPPKKVHPDTSSDLDSNTSGDERHAHSKNAVKRIPTDYKYSSLLPELPPADKRSPAKSNPEDDYDWNGMLPAINFTEDDYKIEVPGMERLSYDFEAKNNISSRKPQAREQSQGQYGHHQAHQYDTQHGHQHGHQQGFHPAHSVAKPLPSPSNEREASPPIPPKSHGRPPPPAILPNESTSPQRHQNDSNALPSQPTQYLAPNQNSTSPIRTSTHTQYYSPENRHSQNEPIVENLNYENEAERKHLSQEQVRGEDLNGKHYIPGSAVEPKYEKEPTVEKYIPSASMGDTSHRGRKHDEKPPVNGVHDHSLSPSRGKDLSPEELAAKKERRRKRREKKKREEAQEASRRADQEGYVIQEEGKLSTRSTSPKDKESRRREREEKREKRDLREKEKMLARERERIKELPPISPKPNELVSKQAGQVAASPDLQQAPFPVPSGNSHLPPPSQYPNGRPNGAPHPAYPQPNGYGYPPAQGYPTGYPAGYPANYGRPPNSSSPTLAPPSASPVSNRTHSPVDRNQSPQDPRGKASPIPGHHPANPVPPPGTQHPNGHPPQNGAAGPHSAYTSPQQANPAAFPQYPGYPPQGYMYPPPQGYYPPPMGYPPMGYPPMGYPPMGYPMGYPMPQPPKSPEKKEKPSSTDVAMRNMPQGHKFNKNKQPNKVGLRNAFNQGGFGI
ncbi:morphogenesis-related protein Msb1p [[Candida] railenensis]|uniref:Morphogenesis-related protein Msb1p n=1 Tax=[Candida] railenensis TaxID=45579 RepID=A0A9P0VX42_9ASCO|nr:morphogenesis-related protein Msb1p [[Candida] railenensis]